MENSPLGIFCRDHHGISQIEDATGARFIKKLFARGNQTNGELTNGLRKIKHGVKTAKTGI
jgi:hypothetical protein